MTARKGVGPPENVAVPRGAVQAFQRNRSFAEEVPRESERLWRRLEEIKHQFDLLRREADAYRQRFQEIERENESLLNMYVSSIQLHGTLDEAVALGVIKEILLNLVGAEVFTIWLLDPDGGTLGLTELVDERGICAAAPRIPEPVWQVVRAGAPWYASGGEADGGPLCCIPLRVDECLVGVLCLYSLLGQKNGFSSLDRELLGLLAGQAGAALIGARAFSRSGMKLKTVPAPPPVAPSAAR